MLTKFCGDEDGIDLGEDLWIIKGQHPTPIRGILSTQHTEVLGALLPAQLLAPNMKSNRPTLSLKIENPPYMTLVIEAIEPGPLGLPGLSVAHYGEQNGDLMRDPEMCFELSQPIRSKLSLDPYYWRNDYVAVEQWSRNLIKGHYVALSSVITLNPAIRDQVKSGHRESGRRRDCFYLAYVWICKAESDALMIGPFNCVLVL